MKSIKRVQKRAKQAPTGGDMTREATFTRRQFLIYQSVIQGDCDVFMAIEAVSSWAIEHPEVDLEEEMTWAEWEKREEGASDEPSAPSA